MISLGIAGGVLPVKDQPNRTCAYKCPKCEVRVQAYGNWSICKCGSIGVAGTIYTESTFGMPSANHYEYSVER